jgi:hypothetical protein
VLRIDQASAFKGSITGFGLTNAPAAVIDLANVKYQNGVTTESYNSTTGVLTIDDHQGSVAHLTFTSPGSYSIGNFHISDDGTGHVKLIDPPMAPAPSHTRALPSVELLRNYMAAGFAAPGSHGGSLVTETRLANEQLLLTHPHG